MFKKVLNRKRGTKQARARLTEYYYKILLSRTLIWCSKRHSYNSENPRNFIFTYLHDNPIRNIHLTVYKSLQKVTLKSLVLHKVHRICLFLIGIHSAQGWTATTRHGATKNGNTTRLKHTGNLFRKNLQLKDIF